MKAPGVVVVVVVVRGPATTTESALKMWCPERQPVKMYKHRKTAVVVGPAGGEQTKLRFRQNRTCAKSSSAAFRWCVA